MSTTCLRPSGKIGAAFGSYGWSGESVKIMNQEMAAMKFKVVHPGLSLKYVPTPDDLKHCRELGQAVGREIMG